MQKVAHSAIIGIFTTLAIGCGGPGNRGAATIGEPESPADRKPVVAADPVRPERIPEFVPETPRLKTARVGEWIDAGHVRVRVAEIKLFPIEGIFYFVIELYNKSEFKRFRYVAWQRRDSLITDEFGNQYLAYSNQVELLTGPQVVDPEDNQITIIQAEFPIKKAQVFTLWLSGETVGSDVDFNFSFTRDDFDKDFRLIERQAKAKQDKEKAEKQKKQ